jgi:hypothetical protein
MGARVEAGNRSPELFGPAQAAAIKAALPDTLIMRSVPVYGEESINIAKSYDGIADYLLLDSHRPSDKQIGALGVPHDWSISRRIVELASTLLAEGHHNRRRGRKPAVGLRAARRRRDGVRSGPQIQVPD